MIHIESIYHFRKIKMSTAKLFTTGRSQAVRLPKEFRFPGTEVRIRRLGTGVLLEPMSVDMKAVFAAIDAVDAPPFPDREQPPPLERDFDFD
jgi:antitoxin VapB